MINILKKLINKELNDIYKKNLKISIRNRYKKMSEGFDKIMVFMNDNYEKESNDYRTTISKYYFILTIVVL